MALAEKYREKFQWPLFSPNDRVLAAVSGGPDSLSLLHFLWTHRDAHQIESVEAAHLDHGLRGEESAAEAAWVAAWCAERGIACHLGTADLTQKRGQSTQEAARAARYAFLETIASAIGADKIVTGHTRDDQTETVLANILRGTGLEGLRGIPAVRGKVVRPLLNISRSEVEAYCAAEGLLPRRDSSNLSPGIYTRNRIRLEILPELRQEFNPRVDDALLRLSEIAARDGEYITQQAQAALDTVIVRSESFRLEFSRSLLTALHPALLRHVLRQAITKLRGTSEGITCEHIERICHAALSKGIEAFALMLPSPACTARLAGQTLTLTLTAPPLPLQHFAVPLPMPGEAALEEIGWRVSAKWQEQPGGVRLDGDAVETSSLQLRNRRDGDRFDPLGMEGRHKKLSDLFTDAKVPRAERHQIPIIADARGILWIVGYGLSERAKITSDTTRILSLSAERVSQSHPK